MIYGSCLNCIYLQATNFKDSKETKEYLSFRQYGCAKCGKVPGGVPLPGKLRFIEVKPVEAYLNSMGCSEFKEKPKEQQQGYKQLSIFDL